MLEYVPVPQEYNPYVRSNGIYIEFNPLGDYKTAYQEICNNIVKTIETYYRDGVIYGASSIAIDWKLERINSDNVGLYRCMWKDKRFAPHLVEFLMDRLHGDPYIKIKISDNLVKRHFIANALNNIVFDGMYIMIPVKGVDEAQKVATIVKAAEAVAKGEVIIGNSLDSDCIKYETSDGQVFSCLIDTKSSL